MNIDEILRISAASKLSDGDRDLLLQAYYCSVAVRDDFAEANHPRLGGHLSKSIQKIIQSNRRIFDHIELLMPSAKTPRLAAVIVTHPYTYNKQGGWGHFDDADREILVDCTNAMGWHVAVPNTVSWYLPNKTGIAIFSKHRLRYFPKGISWSYP
ncbi:hypothetical protein [Methylovirgula sp. HY1]|uniref:hypothetical protein n=1 Tax=Methylovirgula sp. HY1 TaxID=2822761 RepID=UPI001C5BE124|nr:hypothetical protein [Methylovirgula sp. HY1]QXX74243.1 hypothetical protein MHY1_01053 [Methylovirgula sp. HY1]